MKHLCGGDSVVEFFKELPQFLAKAGPILKTPYGDDWERRLQVPIRVKHLDY